MQKYKTFVIILTKIYFVFAAENNYCKSDNEDCMIYSACPEAKKLVDFIPLDAGVIRLLHSSRCSINSGLDCVLCSNVKSKFSDFAAKIPSQLPGSDECGSSSPPGKILNGEITDLTEFPWIALLRYKDVNGSFNYRCHGSIISDRYILTARHCLPRNETKLVAESLHSVVVGEYNTSTTNDCLEKNYCTDPIQEFPIKKYRYFPQTQDNFNDIAILRVDGKIKFSNFVRPICIPFNISGVKNHQLLWVAGWGITENNTVSLVKRKASIRAFSPEECRQRIGVRLQSDELCAGSDNRQDSCKGDSGGPLMEERIHHGERKTFVVGVVSGGIECGAKAGLYTNVFKFMDWIKKTIQEMETEIISEKFYFTSICLK